ncbi:MAG: PAS domain S-box protein [Pseudotabrizicola sp.]|uniref:PAS domain S-box protein n=1 Tax=Pseudotabrizicola sp. TaxID=2939647 RepID=UPI002716E048|nr:PAS domain S-box protein [Pseudotabrizicola sp.]MDO9637816.1 PAS domain S-box protein [Pseudotabrizicola sp.]
MDGTGLAGNTTEAVLLVVSDVVADLAEASVLGLGMDPAEAAIQHAMVRLSGALRCPLRLTIVNKVWISGQGTDLAPGRIVHGGAALDGVSDALPAALRQGLGAVLRALSALHRAGKAGAERQMAEQRAANKLARRDRLLRSMFDLSPVGVVLIDYPTGRIMEVNAAFAGFGNWTRGDLIGATIRSLVHQDHESIITAAVAQLEEGGQFGPIDQQFMRPDGSDFPAVLRGLMLGTGCHKKVVWLLIEDVSELQAHLAEVQAVRDEAVRAREELHTAVQALPHGFMLLDAEDRVVMVNSQMSALYLEMAGLMAPGVRYEDILRAGVDIGWWPEAKGREEAFIGEVLAVRHDAVYDATVDLLNGKSIRVVDRRTPSGGRVGLRIDITAERENQRRLSQVIEGSQAGTWESDFVTGENRVNERWAEMLGWTCAEMAPITMTTWQSLLHPDDAGPTLSMVCRVRQGETDRFDLAFRLRHRAGHWVWVQSRGHVSKRDQNGIPVCMSGVHVDVSALKAAEQRMEQIIEGAEVGTWHHDMTAGLCHVNELWAAMLGYTLEELGPVTDAVWQSLLHPDDWANLNGTQDSRFAKGTIRFDDAFRLRHKDGHWVWVASRGQITAWGADGKPTATSGVHLDISERKRLEVDLEAERDFLSTLMETSGFGILAVDETSRIVFFNREVQRILEQPDEALLNQICDPVRLHLHDAAGEALPFSRMACQLALKTGEVIRDLRLRVHMADGRIKVLSMNAAVLPEAGIAARVVCTITDVTAAAQAEDNLRAAIHRAEEASRAKSQFLANMSHELRTPLNGVLGMAELLAEGVSDPKQGAMLDAIRESGVHLLSVVNDILDLAKIESGKLMLDLAPLSLRDLAKRIELMHGMSARGKGIDLKVSLGSGTGKMRMGDATRLLQVLHNLVGNAIKFTESGSVTVMIEEVTGDDDKLRIVVSDTGIGMSDDQTAIVFDEFTQGDESITRRFGGTGLGLPIVRRLMSLMKGEVALVSASGRGTTVTLTVPMPQIDNAPQSPDLPDLPDVAGLRVLLAEDNSTNRLIMRAMLNRLGITVTLVCDGDEAVEAWAPGQFDVVLLDISMPRKDGLTALTELRDKAGAAGLPPVLAVTAHAMAQNVADYRAAGFADVVTKPISLHALARAIDLTRKPVANPPGNSASLR